MTTNGTGSAPARRHRASSCRHVALGSNTRQSNRRFASWLAPAPRDGPHAIHGSTISGIPSPSTPCFVGIGTVATSLLACRCCPPTSAMSIRPPRTGICPQSLSCSAWLQNGWSWLLEGDHERARPYAGGVLHRAAHEPATGQRAHRDRLP